MVRIKHRYFLLAVHYETESGQKLGEHALIRSIRASVHSNFGDYGAACCLGSLTVKYFNASTRTAIVRSSRNFYEMVRQAICLVTAVGQHPASLQVLHLGGTIRKCQKALIAYNRAMLVCMLEQCTTEAERDRVRELIAAHS